MLSCQKGNFFQVRDFEFWAFISDEACSMSHSGGNLVDGSPPALSWPGAGPATIGNF